MYLVQLLLPVRDQAGRPFGADLFRTVQSELTERFGGVTAYSRAPAEGLWIGDSARVSRDDVVAVEVMVDGLDREWWAGYRERLERAFDQDELVIRALRIERL